MALYNRCFPRTGVKKKYNNRKPWLSEALKNSIRYTNKLYQSIKRIKLHLIKTLINCTRVNCRIWRKRLKRSIIRIFFTRYKNDMKKSWSVMKSIINYNKVPIYQTKFKYIGSEISDGNDISNKFNDFFINIGPTLANAIPHTNISPLNNLGGRVSETIFLSPVRENEIWKYHCLWKILPLDIMIWTLCIWNYAGSVSLSH